MPFDIPAAKFLPTGPSTTTTPPVMYSQQWSPAPSITATAPEFRTAKRSPALPAANSRPDVAPYKAVFPISTRRIPGAAEWPDHDLAAAQTFADVVVCLAFELQMHARQRERAEAL